MSEQHTSVPRWDAVPSPDEGAREIAIVAVGAAGRAVAERWAADADARGTPVWSAADDEAAEPLLGALRERLTQATVGWRLMLSGPELDVLTLRNEAIAAGAIGSEVRQHVTDAARRRVFCTHCHTVTEETVAIAAELTCAGCARSLLVYHHVSRRLGAYMGFMVDAEEPR